MSLAGFGAALIERGAARRHRQLVVLDGRRSWQLQVANSLVHGMESHWLTGQLPTPGGWISPQKARLLLGRETGCAIVDLNHGVDADSIGILAGAIRAGGLMLFLLADSTPADTPRSPYLERLARLLKTAEDSVVLTEGGPLPRPGDQADNVTSPAAFDPEKNDPALPATDCQRRAVESVLAVVSGQRKRPAILVSDRGRGKSAALGIAAGQLLKTGDQRILVTGSRRGGSEALFRHAAAVIGHNDPRLQWCEAEALAASAQPCQLLIIDEAASLPLALLEQLLNGYSRIAMATTVHGYEGTGRGFLLRFRHTLDRVTRGWRKIQLDTPVRWALGDPLEENINRLLVLDAEPGEITGPPEPAMDSRGCVVEALDPGQLGKDEPLLREIFSLLVLSHYKTRPNDLQQLLDNPALQIYRICPPDGPPAGIGRQTLGIALTVREGGLSAEQARAIATGKRRPASHMLPEILAINDVTKAATQAVVRVMRIVVHPSLRRQGLGSRMLQHLIARSADIDLFGTSFGLSGSLIRFWRENGYQLVQIGQQRTLQSGRHSGTFVLANSDTAKPLCERARQGFWRNFPARLATSLQGLETDIVRAIIHGETGVCTAPDEEQLRDVASVVNSVRDPQTVPAALAVAAMHGLAHGSFEDSELVIQRIVQHRSWADCHGLGGEAGWRQGNLRLREAFRDYLATYNPDLLCCETGDNAPD